MVVHLGRLRLVVRRKEGKCKYKYCTQNNIVTKGEKVFLVTKQGHIPGRTVIFYKAFHKDCFVLWALYMHETMDPEGDGRPQMGLSQEDKRARAKLVRTRSRLLRRIRTTTQGDKLDSLVSHIALVDLEIKETGYPVAHYQGRRSQTLVNFSKLIKELKVKYGSEVRVPKSAWDEAIAMGMEAEFRVEMDKWHSKDIAMSQSGQDYESSEEDKEDEVE